MQRHQLHAKMRCEIFQKCALKMLIGQYSRREPEMQNVNKNIKMYAKNHYLNSRTATKTTFYFNWTNSFSFSCLTMLEGCRNAIESGQYQKTIIIFIKTILLKA